MVPAEVRAAVASELDQLAQVWFDGWHEAHAANYACREMPPGIKEEIARRAAGAANQSPTRPPQTKKSS